VVSALGLRERVGDHSGAWSQGFRLTSRPKPVRIRATVRTQARVRVEGHGLGSGGSRVQIRARVRARVWARVRVRVKARVKARVRARVRARVGAPRGLGGTGLRPPPARDGRPVEGGQRPRAPWAKSKAWDWRPG